eukprot:1158197-Pelagomonas_calceolata.AAC.7
MSLAGKQRLCALVDKKPKNQGAWHTCLHQGRGSTEKSVVHSQACCGVALNCISSCGCLSSEHTSRLYGMLHTNPHAPSGLLAERPVFGKA